MASKRLGGKRALVTGASSGIGAALARELAALGASLVITARREDRLSALADELRSAHGVEVDVEAADLADSAAPEKLHAATEGAGKSVDILVNNAGLGAYSQFIDAPWERHSTVIGVNITALSELCRLFAPHMAARGHGHIMNVGSLSAWMPIPGFAVYAASKVYVRNFSEALDYELSAKGVRVIVVNPGGTATEFMEAADQQIKKAGEWTLMSSERCARIAVRKMLAGRRSVITGVFNTVAMFLLRFLPRRLYPLLAHVGMSSGVEAKAS